MGHSLLRRMSVFAFALLAFANNGFAIESAWLAPVDGVWEDPNKWSSGSVPDENSPSFGNRHDVTIDASGSPYSIALGESGFTVVDSLTIDSPDATLRVTSDDTLKAVNGIHVERGTLELDDGADITQTRLSAGAGGIIGSGPNRFTRLTDVTLAADFTAGSYLTIDNRFELEDGTVRFAAGNLFPGTEVLGNGEWQLASSKPQSFDFRYRVRFYEPAGSQIPIGPDVTIRSMGEQVSVISELSEGNRGPIVNQGTILAETDRGSLYISDFRNEGLIRVSGGDRFAAGFHGAVGRIEIGPGTGIGGVSVYGAPHFNEPLAVGDAASLYIRADTQATAETPIQLSPGGVITFATAESQVPVEATGGSVVLNTWGGAPTLTVSQYVALPVTGPAEVRFSSSAIDLEATTFDYTTLPPNFVFNPSRVENGTLAGPASPQDLTHWLRDANLDVPLDLVDGRVELAGTSALLRPTQLSGGTLILGDDWSNTAGIAVSAGELGLKTLGAAAGSIDMTGGTLVLELDTTISTLLALQLGAPDKIDIGRSTGNVPPGEIDLEGTTLDLDAWPATQWTINSGVLRNGTIVGTHEGQELGTRVWGRVQDATLEGVKLNGGRFFGSTLRDVWSTGDLTTDGTVIDSRVDGTLSGGTIEGQLEANGPVRGNVTFASGSSLVGDATLGSTNGRRQVDRFIIVDSTYVIPETATVVSSTQYDANVTIEAPQTGLRIEGDVLVGHEEFVRDSWTDSLTIEAASLHTAGTTKVTEDGRLAVVDATWANEGRIELAGGELEVASLGIEPTGAIAGWGSITAAVVVDGTLATDNGSESLNVAGSLSLGSDAETQVVLGSRENPVGGEEVEAWAQVDGTLLVDGSLELSLSNAFLAQSLESGDQFPLMTAGSLTGMFSGFTWSHELIDLMLVYTADSVHVEVVSVSAPTGDFNLDGFVNAADYTLVRDHHPDTATGLPEWQVNYGNSNNPMPIPEPNALALVFATSCCLGTCIRCRDD